MRYAALTHPTLNLELIKSAFLRNGIELGIACERSAFSQMLAPLPQVMLVALGGYIDGSMSRNSRIVGGMV
jgi:hypothetical protein